MLPLLLGRKHQVHRISSRLRSLSAQIAVQRQQWDYSAMQKERWLEDDVKALAAEEPNVFDRKSGLLLSDENAFFTSLAKALSAFANSGGGTLLLGVEDDGRLTGVDPTRGRSSTKDWLERKIPTLLDYPISDFRVHTVERSTSSEIPTDKVVIVIDVGDSPLAPHQSKKDYHYYHRVGGNSVPAPHFYLDLLRQRLSNPTLDFTLAGVDAQLVYEYDDGLFLEMRPKFIIENTGRMAAYKWGMVPKSYDTPLEQEMDSPEGKIIFFERARYPVQKGRRDGISVDDTILAGQRREHKLDLGVLLRPRTRMPEAIVAELDRVVGALSITYQLATETSPGEPKKVSFRDVIKLDEILAEIQEQVPDFVKGST
jgi:hypothetical protein